jgi:hypothetical protein
MIFHGAAPGAAFDWFAVTAKVAAARAEVCRKWRRVTQSDEIMAGKGTEGVVPKDNRFERAVRESSSNFPNALPDALSAAMPCLKKKPPGEFCNSPGDSWRSQREVPGGRL